jgi:pimeloyl-ACP methyl ester carboxylesterase
MRAFAAAVVCVLCCLCVCVVMLPVVGPAAAAPGDPPYRAPVDSPIVDHFRLPLTPYGPGNRGIDYQTEPGTPIRAAADGVVDFAGPVGTGLHVVIAHPDGLRTSYSFVRTVEVVRGQRVMQGDIVATSTDTFHFGVRDGDVYLDPELVLGAVHLRLTPAEGVTEAMERTVAYLWAEEFGRGGGGPLGWIGSALSSAVHGVLELGELGLFVFNEVDPRTHFLRVAVAIWNWANTECTPAATEVPPGEFGQDVFVMVAGFGSSSGAENGIDTLDRTALGIDEASVIRFSYRGGRTPSGTLAADLATIGSSEFSALDSVGDLSVAADRLAALIEDVRRVRPGARIHLVAHSQGGVVAVDAVHELAGAGGATDIDIVTIGSPHQGATSATMGQLVAHAVAVQVIEAFGVIESALTESDAAKQLSKTSNFSSAHRRAGTPPGVRVTSIGGADDPVVVGLDTHLGGADQILIESDASIWDAHDELPSDSAVNTEVGRALHGQHPSCQSFGRALTNAVKADAIGTAEVLVGAAATAGLSNGGVEL